jgi:hypothetical protein
MIRGLHVGRHSNAQVYQPWGPTSARWDRTRGDVSEAAEVEACRLVSSARLSHQQLVACVMEVQAWISARIGSPRPTDRHATQAQLQQPFSSVGSPSTATRSHPLSSSGAAACHPARQVPFQQLHASVMELVAAGAVERTVDPGTGLEVYCYNMALGPATCPAAAMCRGLVLHPASSTVVATPFVRFDEHLVEATAGQPGNEQLSVSDSPGDDNGEYFGSSDDGLEQYSGRKASSCLKSLPASCGSAHGGQLLCGGERDAANLEVYRSWDWGGPPECASVKVDGCLAIAFLWEGELRVVSCGVMDSEQVGRGWVGRMIAVGRWKA